MNTNKTQWFLEGVWTALQPFPIHEDQLPIKRKHFVISQHKDPYAQASKDIECAFKKVGDSLQHAMNELENKIEAGT